LTLLNRRFDVLDASLLSRDVEDVVAADEGVAVLALQLPVHVLLGLEGRKMNDLIEEVSDSGKQHDSIKKIVLHYNYRLG
jgi:hypothetical protein